MVVVAGDNRSAEVAVFDRRSLRSWREIGTRLATTPAYRADGSWLLTHRGDLGVV